MTFVVLVCAIFSSLAGGVLLAYGLCYGMFHLFRIHSMQAAQARSIRHASTQAVAATAVDTLA